MGGLLSLLGLLGDSLQTPPDAAGKRTWKATPATVAMTIGLTLSGYVIWGQRAVEARIVTVEEKIDRVARSAERIEDVLIRRGAATVQYRPTPTRTPDVWSLIDGAHADASEVP